MPRRLFEFLCEEGHRTEVLTEVNNTKIQCPECNRSALRVISAVRCNLEGITGAFPTAYDAWARKHEQAAKIARKQIDPSA